MKKILAIAYITLLSLTTFAQNYNQNVNFTRTTLLSGKTVVQDTSLYIKSGNDTLTVSNYSDATKLNTTAGNGFHFRKRTAPGYQFLFGDSANGSGSKFFSYIDNVFGFNYFRFGSLANLSGIGLGNGTGYWDVDSNGIGSVVFGLNSRAKGFASVVLGGANCYAQADNSIIIGGASNHTDGIGALIISSSGNNRVSSRSSTIIQSANSFINYDGFYDRNLIIGSNDCSITDSIALSAIISSYRCQSNGTHGLVVGGSWDTVYAYHEVVFGSSAVKDATGAKNSWRKGDFLVHIGNAFDSTSKQDAFMQIKNGNIAIGDSLTLADKPTPGGPMLRVVGTVQVDSLLTLNNTLDSAFIYSLAPSKPALVFCSDCTGNGITGRIVAYIGAAWRRLTFED